MRKRSSDPHKPFGDSIQPFNSPQPQKNPETLHIDLSINKNITQTIPTQKLKLYCHECGFVAKNEKEFQNHKSQDHPTLVPNQQTAYTAALLFVDSLKKETYKPYFNYKELDDFCRKEGFYSLYPIKDDLFLNHVAVHIEELTRAAVRVIPKTTDLSHRMPLSAIDLQIGIESRDATPIVYEFPKHALTETKKPKTLHGKYNMLTVSTQGKHFIEKEFNNFHLPYSSRWRHIQTDLSSLYTDGSIKDAVVLFMGEIRDIRGNTQIKKDIVVPVVIRDGQFMDPSIFKSHEGTFIWCEEALIDLFRGEVFPQPIPDRPYLYAFPYRLDTVYT